MTNIDLNKIINPNDKAVIVSFKNIVKNNCKPFQYYKQQKEYFRKAYNNLMR